MQRDDESFRALSELYEDTPVRYLFPDDRYVIMSDLHIGTGKRTDDFLNNSALVLRVLEAYYDQGYQLILNGDVEELLRFNLPDILRTWGDFYRLLSLFHTSGRLTKLAGNHDLELLDRNDSQFPATESLRLNFRGETIFIFHGHQMSKRHRKHNWWVGFFLKYFANPLRIKNNSVSRDSGKKFYVEKRVYQFSAENRIMSVIGHTHRPLFESMSKIDSLRFEIERLCRKYPKAGSERRLEIEENIRGLRRELDDTFTRDDHMDHRSSLYNENLVVPCMFNSGAVIGKRGITCLEIRDERIGLVHWFDERRSTKHMHHKEDGPLRLGQSPFHRAVIKEDSLEYIFSRIRLLGGAY